MGLRRSVNIRKYCSLCSVRYDVQLENKIVCRLYEIPTAP